MVSISAKVVSSRTTFFVGAEGWREEWEGR